MPITSEQADQVKDIILKTLDTHHKGNLPYREVWTKAPAEDFEGVAFVDVWIIYDGERSNLDIGMLNSYDSFLYQAMFHALTTSNADLIVGPRTPANQSDWIATYAKRSAPPKAPSPLTREG